MRQIGIHSGSSNIDHSRRPAGYDLTSVEVALFATGEGEPIIRSTILGSGIRRLTVVTSPEMLRSAICETEFDMIVLEASKQVEGICDQISDIRQGLLGENPYVVINVASWLSSNDAIRTFINAGTDDITVMPTSVDAVVARLDHIIETRKKFVATLKYLGPDRRAPDRAKNSELCAFKVPNGLRYKATGYISTRVYMQKIRRTDRIAKEHRLRRTALQFHEIVSAMEGFVKENPDGSVSKKQLSEMMDLVHHIAENLATDPSSEIPELVSSLQNVMKEVVESSRVDGQLCALLRVHAEALLALLRGERDSGELVVRAIFTASKIIEARAEMNHNSTNHTVQ